MENETKYSNVVKVLYGETYFFSVPLMFAQILEVLLNFSDVAIVEIVDFLFCFQKIKKKIIDMK